MTTRAWASDGQQTPQAQQAGTRAGRPPLVRPVRHSRPRQVPRGPRPVLVVRRPARPTDTGPHPIRRASRTPASGARLASPHMHPWKGDRAMTNHTDDRPQEGATLPALDLTDAVQAAWLGAL